MAPTDNSPTHPTGGFELISSLEAYNKIPVHEFRSTRSGLTVVIAEVDGPVVNGYFCLATEAHDDDGLPHTLEHLIFLGSEDYPYKGVLDLLANRCLASGTNAWTDIDHTCYTMETAGSEGFLSLLPIFLEHILYPTLTDEGYLTEVHHVTGTGEDAGVVYCEMQGRENSGESRVHLAMARAMYPEGCGYRSETGGIMANLRESTSNEKVRAYHRSFYRTENVRVIVTGHVRPEDVFAALAPLEDKIAGRRGDGGDADGGAGEWVRPWQSAVPPLREHRELRVEYPCDEESCGMVCAAWRGPSAVTQQYELAAAALLLKYLTQLSVSPLQREFVELADPYASKVAYNMYENSESVLYLLFENVPRDKVCLVRTRLEAVLRRIVEQCDVDMTRLRAVIHRHRLESLSNLENNPHQTVAFMLIGHMLYGRDRADLAQRLNPVEDLVRMESEPQSFWLELLERYMVRAPGSVCVLGVPSIEEQRAMGERERARVADQAARLGAAGLRDAELALERAVAHNERPPPADMLTSVPIPSPDSIRFHHIERYSSAHATPRLDLSAAPVFTYLDHVDSNFVYMFALMDTAALDREERLLVPLLLEALFESAVWRDGRLVPHEEVVSELEADTVCTRSHVGLGTAGRFSCGPYATTVSVMLQVEQAKYERGVRWLRDLLYHTHFTADRLQIIATKMSNHVAQIRRSGNKVCAALARDLCYVPDSNQHANSMLRQHRFLTRFLEDVAARPDDTVARVERLRRRVTEPSRVTLYLAADLASLPADPAAALAELVPADRAPPAAAGEPLAAPPVTPDRALVRAPAEPRGAVVGLGCTESSFLYHVAASVSRYDDPDVPALLTYLQYITQLEGPLWKQVRGKGLAYSYNMCLKANEGLLYLVFSRATNVSAAFREAQDIVRTQLDKRTWDRTLLDSARSSLIFEVIDNEKTVGHVVEQSLVSYFKGVDYEYNRWLVRHITAVTEDDLNRVGAEYVARLFHPEETRTAIVCHPSKADEIAADFRAMSYNLEVHASLEHSFLNDNA